MTITDFLPTLCDPEGEDKFNSPFESQGYWVATDRKIAVIIKCEDMPLLGYPHRDIKIDILLNNNSNMNVSFSAKELSAKLIPDLLDEYDESDVKTCTECDGEGDIECECCGHTYECPECNGDGKIGTEIPTGNKYPNPDKLFTLFKDVYKYRYLNNIVQLAEIMGTDEIQCFNSEPYKPLVAKVGCVSVVIMGHTNPYDLETTFIDLTTKPL